MPEQLPAFPVLPKGAEIGANFWYTYPPEDVILRLLARFYVLVGTEGEKLETLRVAAANDWVIARQFEIPSRFHIRLPASEKTLPVTPRSAWRTESMMPLFEDAAKYLEGELPGFCNLKLPEDPLTCFTPIFQNEDGRLEVKIDGVMRF